MAIIRRKVGNTCGEERKQRGREAKTKYPISRVPQFRGNYDTILCGAAAAAAARPQAAAAASLRTIKH